MAVTAAGAQDGIGPASRIHLRSNRDLFARALKKPEEKTAKFADHLFGLDAPGKWLMLDGAPAR